MDGNYEAIVKDHADNQTDKPLPNSTFEHAFIGIKYLIQKASSKIKIVSNQFYEDFWTDLSSYLTTFLGNAKTNSIEIVICDAYKKEGVIDKIAKEFPTQIKVFVLKNKQAIKKIYNFVVIDPVGYRFELSDEEKENRIVSGIINYILLPIDYKSFLKYSRHHGDDNS